MELILKQKCQSKKVNKQNHKISNPMNKKKCRLKPHKNQLRINDIYANVIIV
jgi:hypothetical protein